MDITPFYRQNLTFAPAGLIGKAREICEIVRQERQDAFQFLRLKEPLPCIVLLGKFLDMGAEPVKYEAE